MKMRTIHFTGFAVGTSAHVSKRTLANSNIMINTQAKDQSQSVHCRIRLVPFRTLSYYQVSTLIGPENRKGLWVTKYHP